MKEPATKAPVYERAGAIGRWDEALPLGNGRLGCLVYGKEELRFSLDRIDLWDKRPAPETLEEGFVYENLIRCAKSDWPEHQRLFDGCYNHPYPTKLTAGGIVFTHLNGRGGAKRFALDIWNAGAKIAAPEGNYEAFMSAADFIGVAAVPLEARYRLTVPDYFSRPEAEGGLGYPPAETRFGNGFVYTVQRTKTAYTLGIVVLEEIRAGKKYLYFDVYGGEAWEEELGKAERALSKCRDDGYEKALSRHREYWTKYYAVSSLKTGDAAFDRQYLLGQYFFACTSRKGFFPTPLQGVWTADEGTPPWKGDYHADVNLQLCYEGYLKAGRFEEGGVLCEYLWERRETWRGFARKFYGADGYLVPGVCSLDGKPLGGWPMYSLNPATTIWLAKCFDEYYRYTADEEFFHTKAYPFLKGVAEAVSALLVGEQGGRRLPLSSSPEYREGSREAYLSAQSNFELALLKYLFKTVAEYAQRAGEKAVSEKYRAEYTGLGEYALNDDGTMRISEDEDYGESHRHFSHLLSVVPLHESDGIRDRAAILKNIEKLEAFGTSKWVGFSFACMAELCAYIGDGERAHAYLEKFIEAFVSPNGFHLNGDYKDLGYSDWKYRPFTLEANFGFCKALQDMCLRCDCGSIELFPALPDCWRDNELGFDGLCVPGGVKVSAARRGGKIEGFVLIAPAAREIKIRNVFGREELLFETAGGLKKIFCPPDGVFTLSLESGVCRLCE